MKTTLVALACITAIFASSAASAKPMMKHPAHKTMHSHHMKHKMYHPMKHKRHSIKHRIRHIEKKMGM